jgi:hypothetical protein
MPTHNCLVYSLAMVLSMKPEVIFQYLGHDGQEIIWPDIEEPFNRRGIHIQELIDFLLTYGYTLIQIDAMPTLTPKDGHSAIYSIMDVFKAEIRLMKYLQNYFGILITQNHAVAWDRHTQKVYDPNGWINNIDEYEIKKFLAFVKIQNP